MYVRSMIIVVYNKILKDSHGENSIKTSFIIYPDLEFLLEKMSSRHNNPEKSSAAKANKQKAFGDSLFTKC